MEGFEACQVKLPPCPPVTRFCRIAELEKKYLKKEPLTSGTVGQTPVRESDKLRLAFRTYADTEDWRVGISWNESGNACDHGQFLPDETIEAGMVGAICQGRAKKTVAWVKLI